MAVLGERGALDLQLLSGKVGASAGRGPTAGLGSGVRGAPRLCEGRQVLQSTGASVCCERIGVWVCDVLYNAQACARDVFVLHVCTHTCVWMGDMQRCMPRCQGTAGCMGPLGQAWVPAREEASWGFKDTPG